MVQWAVAEARGRGCKLVELLTHNTRVDAQRFYERLGFARSHVGMTLRFPSVFDELPADLIRESVASANASE